MTSLLCGCDIAPGNSQIIPPSGTGQDLEQHLVRRACWRFAALRPPGCCQAAFDREWVLIPDTGHPTLTTQSRLIFTMVGGFEAPGERHYLDVAVRGADFCSAVSTIPCMVGRSRRVDADGKVINPGKENLQPCLWRFSRLVSDWTRVIKEELFRMGCVLSACVTSTSESERFQRRIPPEAPRDSAHRDSLRTQNPVMQMFEALLAPGQMPRATHRLAGAQSVGNFVLYKLCKDSRTRRRLHP